MLIKLLLIISFVITLSSSNVIISKATEDELQYRLPLDVAPNYYDLKIKIDMTELKFVGDVTINIEVTEETKQIGINYKDIDVSWENVQLKKNDSIDQFTYDSFEEQLSYELGFIRFKQTIPLGNYTMSLSFSGNIRNDLKGLYKSSYNTNKAIATTHFEPSYARMVFPCFDEPRFKAIFKITVIHNDNFKALSNMPHIGIVGAEDNDNFKVTSFSDTPLMSTYLVAFVVSDYERWGSDVDLFVGYAPPGKESYTDDSVKFAPKAMKVLETFLDVDYQLKVTQLVSINDFMFGAMENWGLITFRSDYLLYPNSYVSPKIHQHSRLLISHEFAHMWFGNEVTPEWWTNVWLSEGFAQFFQYYITDKLEANWRIWHQFNVNNLQSALSQDDKSNIRTMSTPILNPSETQFDYIVYAKSSSIIRMFYEIIGNEAFKKALNKYLTENSYKSVEPKHLFESFQSVIDSEKIVLPKSFATLFESWSNELGYPVVNADVQMNENKIIVSQKRFFIDPDMMASSLTGNYYIPITVATDKNGASYDVDWLSPDDLSITIDFDPTANFVILNKLQAGYYRVNYNKDYWLYLANYLSLTNTTEISEENRAQLIDDAANLAKAGLVSYDIVFKLLHNLQHDTGFLPWMAANNAISFLARMLLGSPQYGRFENFLRIIPNKNYETFKINVDYGQHVERLHRVNSVAWACQFGHKECVKDVITIVDKFVTDDSFQFAGELRPILVCTLSRYTELNDDLTQKLITKLLSSFTSPDDIVLSEMNDIITGLGCTRNETSIDSLLDLSTQNILGVQVSAAIRAQIAIALINGSYEGVQIMIRYLSNSFTILLRMYDASGMVSILNTLGSRIVTENVATSFNAFISKYDSQLKQNPVINDAVTKAQTTIAENLKWRKAYGATIEGWLRDNVDDLVTEGSSSIIILSRTVLFISVAAMLRHFI